MKKAFQQPLKGRGGFKLERDKRETGKGGATLFSLLFLFCHGIRCVCSWKTYKYIKFKALYIGKKQKTQTRYSDRIVCDIEN